MPSIVTLAECALVLLAVALAAVASYNRYVRRQVFLVLDGSVGADRTLPPQPKFAPSNLAAMERVASQFRRGTIATTTQIAAAAAAQGEALHWGWAAFPRPGSQTVYIGVMQVQDPRAQRTATALGCASDPRALQVDPCLSSLAKGPLTSSQQQTPCAGDGGFTGAQRLTFDGDHGAVASGASGAVMYCGVPGVLFDYGALDTGSSNGYVYNAPSAGVWVYGVKPPEGSDPRVQPFNAYNEQYSAFGPMEI